MLLDIHLEFLDDYCNSEPCASPKPCRRGYYKQTGQKWIHSFSDWESCQKKNSKKTQTPNSRCTSLWPETVRLRPQTCASWVSSSLLTSFCCLFSCFRLFRHLELWRSSAPSPVIASFTGNNMKKHIYRQTPGRTVHIRGSWPISKHGRDARLKLPKCDEAC